MAWPDVHAADDLDDRALEDLLERAADGDREAEEILIRASARALQRMAEG